MANSCLSVNTNKKQVVDYLFIQLLIEKNSWPQKFCIHQCWCDVKAFL